MLGNNCPYCKTTVNSVNIHAVNGFVGMENRWKCISFSCRACDAVLSIQIYPIAIKTDIIDALKHPSS